MNLDINIRFPDSHSDAALRRIEDLLHLIHNQGASMATAQEVLQAEVDDLNTKMDALEAANSAQVAELVDIKAKLDAALANPQALDLTALMHVADRIAALTAKEVADTAANA